jgi:hypothetical protein
MRPLNPAELILIGFLSGMLCFSCPEFKEALTSDFPAATPPNPAK